MPRQADHADQLREMKPKLSSTCDKADAAYAGEDTNTLAEQERNHCGNSKQGQTVAKCYKHRSYNVIMQGNVVPQR